MLRNRPGLIALLIGLGLFGAGSAHAQTACSVLTQTSVLNSLADNVPAKSITPGTFRNVICSLQNFSVLPNGGSQSDTLANWTSYLAGTASDPYPIKAMSFVAGNPTGGSMGAGTVNATGLFINGAAVSGALTIPNSSLLGGNGTALTTVSLGSGLSLSGGVLSVSGGLSPTSITVGSPTGGALGTGTVNATGLFVNGVAVAGGFSIPNANLLGGTGTALTGVTVGTGLTLGGGTLSVINPYAPSLVGITGGTINGTSVGANTASTGAFTTLSATGTVSGAGFVNWAASPPPIGNTAASSGAFTTLSASGAGSMQSLVVGSPTGGNIGIGTVNATGLYVNGVSVAGGLSVPNSSLLGGNGTALQAVTVSTGLTFSAGALSVTNPYNPTALAATGGTINGTSLGATTPSTGAFTTLSATGAITGASAVLGSPTGGNEGVGTINATGVFVNGVAVAGGLSVPNANLLGGNGSSLQAVSVGSGLSLGSGTLSVTNPYSPGAVAITGGTANNLVIGGTTPAAATVTNLTTTGANSLSTTTMSGKLTTMVSATTAGLNLGINTAAPSSLNTGDLYATSAGLFLRQASTTQGPFGTVSSIATSAPIVGGTITGSGTVSCPTCATTTNGGALSATAPISLSPGGLISLGNTLGSAVLNWNSSTPVTADTYSLSAAWPTATGTISAVKYYTGGSSSPSFVFSVQINGVNVTGCSNITVSSATLTTATCSAANTVTSGQPVTVVTSGISGTPASAVIQVNFSRSNP